MDGFNEILMTQVRDLKRIIPRTKVLNDKITLFVCERTSIKFLDINRRPFYG